MGFLLLAASVNAATICPPGTSNVLFISCYSQFLNWLPIVIVAVFLGFSIVAIYWMIGVLLANRNIQQGARTEFVQMIGTLIFLVIIIFVLNTFGTISQSLLNPTTTQTLCTQLQSSELNIVNSQYVDSKGTPSPANTICSQLVDNVGTGGATTNIDYGLASSFVIIANLTNQTASNLNATYMFESYAGFLASFVAETGVCLPGETCEVPVLPRATDVTFFYAPLLGYQMLRSFTVPLEIEADLVFYLTVLQLVSIIIMLYIWPYVLAAGIVLRSTFFTRRLGGLMMAIALGFVILYPIIVTFEYYMLSTPSSTLPYNAIGVNTAPGANALPARQIWERPLGSWSNPSSLIPSQYSLNFYVLPNVRQVINYYWCLPGPGGAQGGTLSSQEFAFAAYYIIPLTNVISALSAVGGAFQSSIPELPSQSTGYTANYLAGTPGYGGTPDPPPAPFYFGCFPDNALQTVMALIDMYGIMSVEGFIIPLFNVLITLSGIYGLSFLFGGETSIPGLSRLV